MSVIDQSAANIFTDPDVTDITQDATKLEIYQDPAVRDLELDPPEDPEE